MKSVGIIGCGSIANISYASILNVWFKNADKYFYDVNDHAAKEMSSNLSGKSVGVDELIERSDFIIITTPPDAHYDLLVKAIQPGKTIICEKPFLLSYDQIMKIIGLTRSKNARVFAAHVRRFFPSLNLARKFIETGLLGAISKIDLFEGGRFSWESQSGYHYKSSSGGVLPDTGSHSIDSLLFVLGLDTKQADFEVISSKRTPEQEPSHVFEADFNIECENINAPASIHLSRRTFLSNKLNIYGENGIMEIPLDLKNAVKVSTKSGATVLRENHPALTIDDAFNRQFNNILNEDGKLLDVTRFINTTILLEKLLTDPR